jgi:transposase-like protein
MTDVTLPIFKDEEAARKHFEAIRWPNGPVCPHCGVPNEATLVKGKSHRPGLYQCNACREPFTVKVGTVMESSHIPMHKWALGFHLMAASKKGVSAHQLHRMLGVTYKTAWFMAHRIREAMGLPAPGPGRVGGSGKAVEIDETYIGKNPDAPPAKKKRGHAQKMKIVTLIERGGEARSFNVTDDLTRAAILEILFENVSRDASLMTDESPLYAGFAKYVGSHDKINHSHDEYVRGDVHTNTVEGFFSVFKRGMKGVYQHCGKQHLQRYLNEFDFRYSNRAALGVNDTTRARRAIKGAEGKRLTYRQPRPTA